MTISLYFDYKLVNRRSLRSSYDRGLTGLIKGTTQDIVSSSGNTHFLNEVLIKCFNLCKG